MKTDQHPLTVWRKSRNMTLEAFATAVNRSKGTVCKWEKGLMKPRPDCIRKIEEVTKRKVTLKHWVEDAS